MTHLSASTHLKFSRLLDSATAFLLASGAYSGLFVEPPWRGDPEQCRALHNLWVACHHIIHDTPEAKNYEFSELSNKSIDLLKAYGLPDQGDTGPIPWTGTPDQQTALSTLHRVIRQVLSPLPEQEGR